MTTPTTTKARFNPLTVSEIRRLTDHSVEVSFEVPVELRSDYNYIPGQYVALRTDINGQQLRRSYSICDIPTTRDHPHRHQAQPRRCLLHLGQ
jgi:Flavodoxin reductases (ferredoxin-NADPH reductases) family 1